jgi:hypothetical protein
MYVNDVLLAHLSWMTVKRSPSIILATKVTTPNYGCLPSPEDRRTAAASHRRTSLYVHRECWRPGCRRAKRRLRKQRLTKQQRSRRLLISWMIPSMSHVQKIATDRLVLLKHGR